MAGRQLRLIARLAQLAVIEGRAASDHLLVIRVHNDRQVPEEGVDGQHDPQRHVDDDLGHVGVLLTKLHDRHLVNENGRVVEGVEDGDRDDGQLQHVEHDEGQHHPLVVAVDAGHQDGAEQGEEDDDDETDHQQGAGVLEFLLGVLSREQLAQVRDDLVVARVHLRQLHSERQHRDGAHDL